jgi:hypothetical protein
MPARLLCRCWLRSFPLACAAPIPVPAGTEEAPPAIEVPEPEPEPEPEPDPPVQGACAFQYTHPNRTRSQRAYKPARQPAKRGERHSAERAAA